MPLALIRRVRHLLLGAALVALGVSHARAEGLGLFGNRSQCPTCPCPCPCPVAPEVTTDPTKPSTTPSTTLPSTTADSILAPVTAAATGGSYGSFTNTGAYIDNALPVSHVRIRYDSAYNDNRPDRAEYFYAKCGCFNFPKDVGARGPGQPSATNPKGITETSVDYQDISAYVEVAKYGVFSGFVDLPVRFLNPEKNSNTTGIADMNFGVKAAVWNRDNTILTFQFRTYIPTGDSDRGLGTNHVSLEPSLIFAHAPSDDVLIFGQVGDWIPIGGSDFAGNVLRYGVGASWIAVERCNWRMAPVAEVLGWTALSGKSSDSNGITSDARGSTIVNGKLGVRFGFGELDNMAGLLGNSDLYIGYGRALTGDVWYTDILRIEYRLAF